MNKIPNLSVSLRSIFILIGVMSCFFAIVASLVGFATQAPITTIVFLVSVFFITFFVVTHENIGKVVAGISLAIVCTAVIMAQPVAYISFLEKKPLLGLLIVFYAAISPCGITIAILSAVERRMYTALFYLVYTIAVIGYNLHSSDEFSIFRAMLFPQ